MSGLGEPAPCPATRTAEIGSVPPESTSGKPNSIPPDSGLNGAAREHDKAGEDAVCVEAEDSRIQSPSPADAGLTPFVAACAAFASLNSANLGYDIGVSGGAFFIAKDELALSEVETEFIIGSLNVMAVFGAMVSRAISDTYGRTKTLAIASAFFFAGSLVLAAASSFGMLLLGRMMLGLGVGAGLSIDPLYISEISPPAHRG